ncbi:CCA tRNA nucleotidyltransferase [Synechococcus sp. ROS8604]|uniref:CCA tRNA nucleotidyltransferase n=1 Tax=Synechococcus sp. ROS8604 TaxID=1442557 RepID=UPI001647BD57|nr:CCA tRNA nucleotidyltransferase [Synechococcus sp. ROS8604]QNI87051.1 poly(A) polymerase [Synechococcus sp. ROS8604]
MERPGLPVQLLPALQASASAAGVTRLALVGGAVRDALLHDQHGDPWRTLPDLDLVIEGSASEFAAALEQDYGDQRVKDVRIHTAYGTAELSFDGVLIDLAAARQEHYPAPGENPVVESGSLERDLERRDFTVNAMALELPLSGHGEPLLLDQHGGQGHLERRELAFLHASSVTDDPTRVVRAGRYVARLAFVLAAEAQQQIDQTLEAWPWSWTHGDPPAAAPPALATRLRMELELLFDQEPWLAALEALHSWGALRLLDPALQTDSRLIRRLLQAQRLQLPLLLALVAGAADPLALAARLQLPQQQQRWLQQMQALSAWLPANACEVASAGWTAEEWCDALEQQAWGAEAVALLVSQNPAQKRPLLRWWGRWRHCTSPLSAKDLLAQGWQPGPALGAELQRLRRQRLRAMR